MVEIEFSYLNDTLGFPFFPSFVVTKITPLAPLAPYNEVAVASFIIEKLAILSGSILAKSFVVTSKPSIKISGLLAYPNFKRSIILSDDIREFTGPYLGEKRHLISEIVTKFDKHKLLLDTSLCHENDNYFILNVEESNASAVKRSIKFANILFL